MANLKLMELARQIQSGIRHPTCSCELPCSPKTVEDGQKEAKRKIDLMNEIKRSWA